MSAPAAAPLPQKIPIKDQVNGAGLRPDEIAKLPVSGAFKFESVTPRQELRLAKNPNYTSSCDGQAGPPRQPHLEVVRRRRPMIAGFKAGEVDFATDLQDSDIPKVQDLGDQVSAIPALLYEFLRPNWSETVDATRRPVAARATRPSPTAARAARWPTRRCARPSAYAIDKNEINTRLLGGTVQVANTNISPERLVLR